MKDAMVVETSPTAKKKGETMLHHPAPPSPPITYTPTSSPTHRVFPRHPGGSYSSPRVHHHSLMGMNLSPYGHRSVPVSPVAGSRLGRDAAVLSLADGFPMPEPLQQQKAREAAIAAEHTRTNECEKEELHMPADELRTVLKKERRRTTKIVADLASFKCLTVQQHLESEVVEEGRVNDLMRRVDYLQHEKEQIIVALEREEELLTNNLQRKLEQTRQEKRKLESQIDQEKKVSSALRSQLSNIRSSQVVKATNLEAQEEMEEE